MSKTNCSVWFIILCLFNNLSVIFISPINSSVFELLVDHFTKTIFLEQPEKYSLYCIFSKTCYLKESNLKPISNNIYHCLRENYGKNNRYIEENWNSQRSFLWITEVKINENLKVKSKCSFVLGDKKSLCYTRNWTVT